MYFFQNAMFFQIIDKDFCCSHRSYCMRWRGTYSNRKKIKSRDNRVMIFMSLTTVLLNLSCGQARHIIVSRSSPKRIEHIKRRLRSFLKHSIKKKGETERGFKLFICHFSIFHTVFVFLANKMWRVHPICTIPLEVRICISQVFSPNTEKDKKTVCKKKIFYLQFFLDTTQSLLKILRSHLLLRPSNLETFFGARLGNNMEMDVKYNLNNVF